MEPVRPPSGPPSGSPFVGAAGGEHWLVDVRDVPAGALSGRRGREVLEALFQDIVEACRLTPIAPIQVHVFDAPDGTPEGGGSTALLPLSESHLAAHGFPEDGLLCLDLFTCRPRGEVDWQRLMHARYGAVTVVARRLQRGLAARDMHGATPGARA